MTRHWFPISCGALLLFGAAALYRGAVRGDEDRAARMADHLIRYVDSAAAVACKPVEENDGVECTVYRQDSLTLVLSCDRGGDLSCTPVVK